jgi:thiamine-phosphate pyrophosphorylase
MLPSRPLFCLVTDRHALAAALGNRLEPVAALLEQVRAAAEAGVDLVQVRERDLEAGPLCDLVGRCVELVAGSRTRVVVNDRLDVALAARAHGVHLRGDSVDAARISALAAGFLIGQSVRSAATATSASGAHYLVLGTIFPTPSKPGLEAIVGLGELEKTAHAASVPVLAIGGMTEERLAEVAKAGAAGVAAIRLFFPGAAGWSSLRARVARARAVFDMYRVIS